MVGIVIVSHSDTLARGVVELARGMGGDDVVIEAAGGTGAPDAPLGTDALRVAEAVDRAFSQDGVLVLMDIGSALLSAEMALDFIDVERRPRVLLCEAPLVEGAVSAAAAARIGRSLQEVAVEARGALEAKVRHLHAEPEEGRVEASAEPRQTGEPELRIVVPNRLGLHARPATRFVQLVAGFEARVEVSNAGNGRGPADGRSLNGLATLGLRQGDEMVVRAEGPQARDVLAAVEALAAEGFGDVAEAADGPGVAPSSSAPAVPEGALVGIPASPGTAVGPARHLSVPPPLVASDPSGDPEEESRLLHSAVEAAKEDLRRLRRSVAGRAGEYAAAIFDAHVALISDDWLTAAARSRIQAGAGAGRAWSEAIAEVAEAYRGLDDEYQRARAADVIDAGDRVLRHLAGRPEAEMTLRGPGVVVAPDLTPAQTAGLDPELVAGIATAAGGPLSHAAILARSLGIPAAVGLGPEVLAVPEGTLLRVDGDAGSVEIGVEEGWAPPRARRRPESVPDPAPAFTRDGLLVPVMANVGSVHDVAEAVRYGADGVGLLRSEFLYLGRASIPGEDEQLRAYQAAADALGGRPLVVRTLDAGSDKPLPVEAAGPARDEENPALGLRGLRLTLARPELLVPQLRAALRVASDGRVMVMFPMVSTLEELRAARALVAEVLAGLGEDRGRVAATGVGIMVEVPAAALTAGTLASEADFFSVGTNDLTQYTMAADRTNAAVAALGDGLHPAVLRLVAEVAKGAAEHRRPVAVCGELAADPLAVPVLLGLGVTELSVRPRAVPAVKRAVRAVDRQRARELASAALDESGAAGVRRLLATAGTAA